MLMRLVRWSEQALSPVGWKWEGLWMGHTKGLMQTGSVPAMFLHYPQEIILLKRIIIFLLKQFVLWCAAEVFWCLFWLHPLKTKQHNVSCSQWLTYSHPPSFLFKLVQSVVVEKMSLYSWTTPIFPVILTLRDCPIRIPYKPLKIHGMNKTCIHSRTERTTF